MSKTQQISILHLDDDALYLEQFAGSVARARLDVAMVVGSVASVAEYWTQLAAAAPDIVVLDINIDGEMRGQEVATRTKALLPSCLVFMCSDLRGIGLLSACLNAGADDFIFKDGDERELPLRIYGTWKLRSEARLQIENAPGAVGRTMQAVATRLSRIARSAISAVHVRGESGTGKELVSDLLQQQLPKGTPFVRVNCGAIAPTLLESELFGHVRGAFTGAATEKIGLVEKADRGWIFFDEVATLSAAAQIALLRVLENHTVRKVGGNVDKQVRIRVLSATNESIEKLIEAGRFRADLWQRLRETTIELPPLRQRMEEFPELVRFFCEQMPTGGEAKTTSGGHYAIAESAVEALASYSWREGNVRELRNCLRAMTEMAVGNLLTPLSIPKWFWERVAEASSLAPSTSGRTQVSGEKNAKSHDGEIVLTWPHADGAGTPTFAELTERLLIEMLRRESNLRGKISIRHLAKVTGIPKSTLAGRLRLLTEHNLIEHGELAKLVNIGGE